ncbi:MULTISPECIES: flagellin lysine-N-methylase [unclassified Clostridium]|uniref:flagellin lysine-N-methylase n=1 Tax=unclassified Clostridium TaxID=2614128 RepID=UPI0013FC42BC|nr:MULTISPECIES: flagellin lysine-N-methylase [unclassified Clostridium]NFR86491.1 hypothetical protein [Clostridium botulinum]NFR89401.1 hypothetical protein [Clostridium botulinum]NFT98961.1 hypothetical protein [Clostridium botulinum]
MEQNERKILIPQYIKKFKCIGSNCEDSCCIGWRIDIDYDTYRKYKTSKDKKLQLIINKNISKNRSGNQTHENYAKIKLKNNKCPFLGEEKLCKIQLEKGYEYLSKTCATYPRYSSIIDGILEKSLTMSCPEAVRLALLNPKPMEFDEEFEPRDKSIAIQQEIRTNEIKSITTGNKYFWKLRIFIISLLQNRRYDIEERMIILGLFVRKVQECIDNKRTNDIPIIIKSYTEYIQENIFKENLENIPTKNFVQLKLLKNIIDKKYSQGIKNKRYLECFDEFLKGIDYEDDKDLEEISLIYKNACNNYYTPFFSDKKYILENYLVNYVFKNTFPFSNEKSIFDEYMMLVIHYSLIKMHLIGVGAFHKGLSDELVVKVIQSIAKTIEHNTGYLNNIKELMKDNKFNNMAYMAVLLKN